MAMRLLVLRSMLGFLFAAAGLGIFSVFFPTQFGVKMLGTSIVIAVASGLFIPVMPRRDAHTILMSGKVWMVVVALEALSAITLIWDSVINLAMNEATILISQAILFCAMIAAIVPLKLIERSAGKYRRIELASLIVTGGGTMIIIGALLVLDFTGNVSSKLQGRLFEEWWVLVLGGLVAVACAAGWVGRRSTFHKYVASLGFATTILSIGLWQGAVYSITPTGVEPVLLAPSLLSTGIAVGLGIYSIGALLPLGRIEGRLLPLISFFSIAIGVLGALLARIPPMTAVSVESTTRVLAAVSIVEVCLVLTVIVLWRLGRRAVRPFTILGSDLTCPRCGKRSTFATGENPCGNCGFLVLLAFRDVTCSRCKHDVRALETGHPCPECGLEVERTAENYLAAGTSGATGTATPSV